MEVINETGLTGLVGTIAVKVEDNDGGTPLGPTTANITELGTSGVYVWNAPAAPAVGTYTVLWSTDGTFDPDTVSSDELTVVASLAESLPSIPAPDSAASTMGPCTAWITGADVAACCSAASDEVGTFTSLLDDSAGVASQLLYELSGRRWAGLCSRENVRPCHSDCGCGWQVLSRGHIVAPNDDGWLCAGANCPCHDGSRVKLAGWVREITQVKIDGVVMSASDYRVDEHKWLTRTDGGRWPSCARRDLPDTEEGTFSVAYTYGVPPPLSAVDAAKQLACQVFLQCSGNDECQIPTGATRITRAGITIERGYFSRNPKTGAWQTGINSVDYFLNTYNPHGLRRRALFFGPGSRQRYARPVG
jgi:hypothetical protein